MPGGSHAIDHGVTGERGKSLAGEIRGYRVKSPIIGADVKFQGGRAEGQTVRAIQTRDLLDHGAGYRIELNDFTSIENRKQFAGVVIDDASRRHSTIEH